jgi:hypothetical protein
MSSPEVVLPRAGSIERLAAARNLSPFGALQRDFADAVSRQVMRSPRARSHPELIALGYWLRAANMHRLVEAFERAHQSAVFLPRGLAFHVAPNNVETIFAYSWLTSLLCGNRNVVRLSSRGSEQTDVLLGLLAEALEEPRWADIAQSVLMLRYGHDEAISADLSARCDVRVIWGGDDTVRAIRALPLGPCAVELTFADKFSLGLMHSAAVLQCDRTRLQQLAADFYNDAYWFGQMACSSPRLVLWLGSEAECEMARRRFWPVLEDHVRERNPTSVAADFVNKRVAADSLAIVQDVRIEASTGRVARIWMDAPAIRPDLHCGAGLFHETRIDRLEQLLPHVNRRIQTVGYFGLDRGEIIAFLRGSLPDGIDRFVPFGRALEFDPVWDGYDLLRSFVRQVSV